MEQVLQFLMNHYPVIIITALIVGGACKFYYKHTHRITDLENKNKELSCKTNTAKIEAHAEMLSRLDSSINRTNILLDKLLFANIGKDTNPLTESHSPITLSKLGIEVAKKMNIYTIIDKNWAVIDKYISENTQSKNAYDIQKFCIETATLSIEELLHIDDLNAIKLYAFNEGKTLGYYGNMIGVIIRDKFFKEHHIDTGEIDKNDPELISPPAH